VIPAFAHDAIAQVVRVQTGKPEQIAANPGIQQPSPVFAPAQVKAIADGGEDMGLGAIDGETSRRKENVIQECSSRSGRTYHKNRIA